MIVYIRIATEWSRAGATLPMPCSIKKFLTPPLSCFSFIGGQGRVVGEDS